MYPPLPILNRVVTKNYTIPDTKVTLRKGTFVVIPNQALQTDPDFFSDPEDFNPSRFADEEMTRRNQYILLAFGEGPRQCIGINIL
jgi:cytochrome P450 family 6